MNYGFITICVLMMISLLLSANNHGKPRINENFWTTLISQIIMIILILWAMHFKIN